MAIQRPLVCPVLVGRDDLLALADRRIGEAAAGDGLFLLLAGEAGVGKTRLLGAIERRAAAAGFRAVRGGTYPSDLQVPGAILIDLARAVRRSTDEGLAARGRDLESMVLDLPATVGGEGEGGRGRVRIGGDAHRRRRVLTLDIAEAIIALADGGPTLVELEDLHWCDDLTLQVLETVAHRIADAPLLMVGTYRIDELFPRAPVREWRGRLVGRRLAEEARLARLGPEDTARMTTLLLGSDLPAPRDLATAIQDRSDGIPLHVEEILALMVASGAFEAGPDLDQGIPGTVGDAITARLATRSAEAIELAQAGAVIGRSFDLALLADVTGRSLEAIAGPLQELGDHFILLPSATPGRFAFRHALICDVIYDHIAEPERRRLHGRTADAARSRSEFALEPFLALHLERAGRPDEAFPMALAGARAASARSSHAEALGLYQIALRTAARNLPAPERGDLLEGYAATAAASDDNVAADVGFAEARAAYLEAGDHLRAAAVLGPHSAVRHLLGDDLDARTSRLRVGLDELDAIVATGGASARDIDLVRGRLLAALAAANMLDRRLDASIAFATEARRLSAAAGDTRTERHAATTLGSCLVFAGRMDEGWDLLEDGVADATAGRRESEAARAYRMLGSCASVLVEYDRGERWLRDGIADAERAELWNDRHYMAAHLAHVLWATGRWTGARDLAGHALADGRGAITTRITALHVLGFVALGRGELDGARSHLDEARALGERMHELQRLSPALWGLAEVELATGNPGAAFEHAEHAAIASEAVDDAAYLYPFALTGTRALLAMGEPGRAREWLDRVGERIERRSIPGTMPALDHGRGLLALAEGSGGVARSALMAAVAGWQERHRVWEGAWGQVDLARCHLRSNQRSEASRAALAAHRVGSELGAPALVAAAAGLIGTGRRRDGDVDPWAPLTAREFEVARGVARGLTNPEIAAELGIKRKTVAAHVEHMLDKLGMARRTEVAAWAATRPVLHSRPHGDDREE